MPTNLRLRMQVVDRVGAMAQIAVILADIDLNILAMEVEKECESTYVYLDLEIGAKSPDPQSILSTLQQIPNIIQAEQFNTLPQERREKRFKVVLDSISDGILSINEKGELTTINRVASKMLGSPQDELLGRKLGELDLNGTRLISCLSGKSYRNVKRSRVEVNQRLAYLASGQSIRVSKGRIVRAVEVLQGTREIRELASAVADQSLVTFGDMIGQSVALQQAISFAEKDKRRAPTGPSFIGIPAQPGRIPLPNRRMASGTGETARAMVIRNRGRE